MTDDEFLKKISDIIEKLPNYITFVMGEAVLKHGLQADNTLAEQYVIAAEEFGEVAKAILEYDSGLVNECYQTIAMLVKIIAIQYKEQKKGRH